MTFRFQAGGVTSFERLFNMKVGFAPPWCGECSVSYTHLDVYKRQVQNGKDLLIKVDMVGDGQFVTLAGLRATRISFNAETADVTSLESVGGWRELLALSLIHI